MVNPVPFHNQRIIRRAPIDGTFVRNVSQAIRILARNRMAAGVEFVIVSAASARLLAGWLGLSLLVFQIGRLPELLTGRVEDLSRARLERCRVRSAAGELL